MVQADAGAAANYVGVDGAKCLAESLGKLAELTSVDLTANYQGLTDEGATRFVASKCTRV